MAEATRPPLSGRQRVLVRGVLALFGLAFLGAALYVLATVKPTDDSYYPKCMSYRLAGIHCPGCGLTRAVHALLNGQIAQAFAYNPLIALLSPYLLFAALRSTWFWLWGTTPRRTIFPASWTWPFFIVLVGYWILRNVPYYPFNLLAPHELAG